VGGKRVEAIFFIRLSMVVAEIDKSLAIDSIPTPSLVNAMILGFVST
jgi:hypothetical protein